MNWFQRTWHRFKHKYSDGFFPWRTLHLTPQFNNLEEDAEQFLAVISNPAFLKVVCLQCDLFSLAKPYVYRNGVAVKKHPALDRINNPNPMQTRQQWLWDYMFWVMIGNAYLYNHSDIIDRSNAPMYWLVPDKIDWPFELDKYKDNLFVTDSKLNEVRRIDIKYDYENGGRFNFKLSQVDAFAYMSNGHGNWWKGYSTVHALRKVIANSEVALDSNNINLRYAGKFLVAGQQDPKDTTKRPMSEDEKKSIEERIDGDKSVHAIKSMIDIKRFVEDARALQLSKEYLDAYFVIGNFFNIPRDVLEAYQSSTFENQEKATAKHVSYTLEPRSEPLTTSLHKRWEMAPGDELVLSWDHLPFNQVFEKERANVQATKINTLNNMLRAGIPISEINVFLDTEFTLNEQSQQNNSGANQGAGG